MRLAAMGGLLVVCLSASPGQGVITGSVFDPSGAVLAKVDIGTNIPRKDNTVTDGSYRFNLVPPGKYTVAVKASGSTEKLIRDVIVTGRQVMP